MIHTLDHNSTFVDLLRRVEQLFLHGRLRGPEYDYILIESLMETVFLNAPEPVRVEVEMVLTSVLDLLRWPPQNWLVN